MLASDERNRGLRRPCCASHRQIVAIAILPEKSPASTPHRPNESIDAAGGNGSLCALPAKLNIIGGKEVNLRLTQRGNSKLKQIEMTMRQKCINRAIVGVMLTYTEMALQ